MDLEWIDNQPRAVETGDRIKLVNMPDDPNPLEAGTEGTVTSVDTRMEIIGVEWDNGSRLNLVLGVDSFSILNESSDKAIINKSMPSPTLKGRDISPTRTSMNNNFKTQLKKAKVKDIKVESEELEGGKADGMSAQDLADKHKVDIKDIQKELELGIEIEMEHTNSPIKAKEVVMDHLFEFPDYYSNEEHGLISNEKGLEKVHENTILEFFGSMGNAFGNKQNKDDQYNLETLGKDLKKITDTLKTAEFPHRETIRTMIEKFREKYSNHSMIDTMMKSLYHEFDKIGGGDIEETTSAGGSSGAFSGPLGGVQKRNESRIIKVRDLLEGTTTTNSGDYQNDSETPFDSNKDGWFWNDKPWWEGGEIVDDIAQLDHNWKDDLLSVKMTKEELVNTVNLLEGKDKNQLTEGFSLLLAGVTIFAFYKFIKGITDEGELEKSQQKLDDGQFRNLNAYVKYHIKDGGKIEYKENGWFHVFEVGDVTIKINKNENTIFWTYLAANPRKILRYKPSPRLEFTDIDVIEHEHTKPIPISQQEIDDLISSLKEDLEDEKTEEELEETTTASSSGQFQGPMFAAKDDESWKPGKKPIWKGGKIVQKVKNSGVLSEINKIKWHKDGSYVKLKDSCVKYNNQPWCSAGDADKPLILSKTTSDNMSEVAKKLGISKEEVKKVVINQLSR